MLYAPSSSTPAALPQTQLTELQPGVTLLAPLSRRGHGPGIILLTADSADQVSIKEGVPSASVKWAEEGFAVAEIQATALAAGTAVLKTAFDALKEHEKCDSTDKIGLVAYDPELWSQVLPALHSVPEITGAIVYANKGYDLKQGQALVPVVVHFAGEPSVLPKRTPAFTEYFYPSLSSFKFATPFSSEFNYSAEAVSHTRNLTFIKPLVGGPFFDLDAIWDEHTHYEFTDRSVEHTMATMVQEPYVNHIPTMTGGIGRERLSNFYRHHFIFQNSDDTELELISRTVGIDRVIDEFIYKFTHGKAIDWLVPGIPPTGKYVEIPMTAVVNIRGDRLYHEHIAWDQASVLRQLGLLPEFLPFPYPLPDGQTPAQGKQYEYKLPVAGVETASKMREKNSTESNEMFGFAVRETDLKQDSRL
ncbi:hypothetical protein EDB81DRAFT_463505 [Dactylonectria macrodidyma]|uniref:Carboxymethylenebutenolidase n=1 Tax=Dactylonectria macrodidyma TaxID=307937 RepID=A0A9P9EV51_9HYPO|nr:hypothetical protein EDB81DRAFT_463505 [Dactylonectria macrodidyma]